MFTISPSVYSADLMNLRQVLESLEGFEHLHLDVDDGNFVRGISFGMDVIKGIAGCTSIPLDAHLEVLNPLDYVKPLCEAGVEMICAHIETLDYPSLFLNQVRKYGRKAGLALNIKTPAVFLEPYAGMLDQVIVVSCEADANGLKFCDGVLAKVEKTRRMFGDDIKIWVDGGVNETNLNRVVAAGADGVVLGRAVFGQEDPSKAYERLLRAGREWERECKSRAV